MLLQLALDRFTVEEAIQLAYETRDQVDWLEIGTSLVKEFGMESIQKFRYAFPAKTLVADMKINDNAKYECKLAFDAGADVVTVMGASPL
ncbi:orotidine 5'-phosphate decarboxylase / HUMPS family protein [Virgibacillus phasianinus]|uniref:orotidine 5'-phosphate decarboxylase / HUMPS family protein n=1 Tax=Virgibacillus phasianinus TaxID=2017483 RepID=UPI001FE93CC6|nr:orotidine 5'-phosphate decarboxylase / HUMPS family protein [Virgibacillus phasianinus]